MKHILDRVLKRMVSILRRRLRKQPTSPVYNLVLGKEDGASNQLNKRALVSYLVHPFSMSRQDPRFLRHINIWHAREMVRTLNRLGYVVDVVDYRDIDYVPQKAYDLFIGHGGINYQEIASALPEGTTKIYFSTGCYWQFHNRQELARFAALRARKGVELPLDRFIYHNEEEALHSADWILGLGNAFTRRTYAGFPHVTMLNGTSLFDDHFEQLDKDYDRGRNHFLYYAGGGCVHKGLDLLLEVFSELDLHLWICSGIGQEFGQIYAHELGICSNIHPVGWIQPRAAQYYELMKTCNFVILPSCSEGQAQSIVECMNQGLIPIVSQACGLDVDEYGMLLNPCTVQEIARAVVAISSESTAWCQERSFESRSAAVQAFSEEAFSRNLEAAIRRVIEPERKEPVRGSVGGSSAERIR